MTGGRTADIAIIGMSAMYAGASGLRTFWQNILDGKDCLSEAPDGWGDAYYDPQSAEVSRIYTKMGGFVDREAYFNPAEFGIMPNTVPSADPDHFLGLKLAKDALLDAGYGAADDNHDGTGIILGRATYPNRGYGTLIQHGQTIDQVISLLKELHPDLAHDLAEKIRRGLIDSLPALGPEMMPNMVPNVISGRIANRLNLMGPNYLIDAACASSLLAIEAAARELVAGACDMMIAGGMHLIVSPQHYMLFSQLNGLSRSKLHPFGDGADGTLLGEGIGLFVLKRLADAERDNDRIYAVLKGAGSSSDGRAVGLLAPRGEGQLLALRRAYEATGIAPSTVTLIEAHGTGMPLGDQTEVATLKDIFGSRDGPFPKHAVGSVKSMIGHCLPAAGAAGMIKAVLALYNKVLPPTLCTRVSEKIGVEATDCYVNNALRPWIHGDRDHPRRAAVNAFGFGGINAHIILEEYEGPAGVTHSQWPAELIVLSAASRSELAKEVKRLADWLAARSDATLCDLAFTLARKPVLPVKLALVAKDRENLAKQLASALKALEAEGPVKAASRAGLYYGDGETAGPGKIAFLFPGEGGQHHDMAADLCLHAPDARNWFDMLDRALADDCPVTPSAIIFPAPTTLSDEDRKRASEYLFSMEIASATVFTASMAIYEFLDRLGVPCDMMLGHSTGEGAAMVASGLIRHDNEQSVEDGILAFYKAHHAIIEAGAVPRGSLLTVGGVDPQVVIDLVGKSEGRLHLALDNCPNQAVLYGEVGDIEKAAERLKAEGGVCIPLPFDRGYHTPLSQGAEPFVRKVYDGFDIGAPKCDVYSCASAWRFPKNAAGVRDLATQQIYSRVRFRETVERLYAEGARTFIEVGPGGSLTGFVRDSLHGKPCTAMATAISGRPVLAQILNVAAQLFVQNVPVKLAELFAARPAAELDLASAEAPKVKKGPRLELDIPLMSLPESAVEEFRARQRPAPAAAAPSPVKEAPPAETSRAAGAAPPVAAEWRQPPPADPRSDAMRAHFGLMNEFLSSQSRIHSLLGLSDSGQRDEGLSGTAGGETGDEPASRRFLLLGDHIHRTDSGLVIERHLTIDDYAFVRDHTIGCPPSPHNPNLLALPVIPFSVSMEIVAETAAAFDGAMVVSRLTECRGYRWLAFDQGELSLRITATIEPSGADSGRQVHVRIFELGNSDGKQTQFLAFEGKAHLEPAYPQPPQATDLSGETFFQPNYAADMLYGYPDPEKLRYAPMFHGPMFQAVKAVRRWSAGAIEADLVAPPTNGFARNAKPAFEMDPVLVDAASHLIAYWAGERFGVDLSSFPFAALDYRQYAPVPENGEPILCRVKIDVKAPDGSPTAFEVLNAAGGVIGRMPCADAARFPDPPAYDFCRLQPANAILDADFEFLDGAGRVIATLRGWQDKYFTMPHRFYRCRLWPQTEFFSDPWMQQETGVFSRRITGEANDFLEDAWGIWKRVLVSLVMSEDERQIWYALPAKGARRSEWLLGRIAAKDAVRQWAEQTYGLKLAPADVQILPDRLGKPTVVCPFLSERGPVPEVSITHSRGRIVAAAAEPGKPLGVDLSRYGDARSGELLMKSFEPSELALLDAATGGRGDRDVIAFWCAKEAAAKALGEGLGGEPRNWLVESYSRNDGRASVRHGAAAYDVRLWSAEEEIFAVCRQVRKQPQLIN